MAVLAPSAPAPTLAAAPPDRSAAAFAVGTAVTFTGAFTLLGFTFDYPAVLDQPALDVLARYAEAGTTTRVLWYLMFVASAAFVPLAVLLGRSLAARAPRPSALGPMITTVGVLAGVVQAVGFARWTFAMPYLAATATDPGSTDATRAASVVVYETMHRFVGGALGEHLGFALTAIWTAGVAVLLARLAGPRWVSAVGVVAAAAIVTGVAEVTGATWPSLPVAGGYVLFAAWLVVVGALLVRGRIGGAR